jgi:UDP-N-acetylmuramoylalanine--D-glutamate ligase
MGCADALLQVGARVTALDDGGSDALTERATLLEALGATVRIGPDAGLGDGSGLPVAELLVVSPGLRPDAPIIAAANSAGLDVWGELELAWRLRPTHNPAPWLLVTGTNGKTTVTMMLASMLQAAGLRAPAVGNIGESAVIAVMDPEPADVLAVEVGAPQLPFTRSISAQAAVCLNIAPDHIDHFGSLEAYIAAKAKVYERTQIAAVYNVYDEVTRGMVEDAEVIDGCRAVGFTLGIPTVGMLGVVDDMLVDRAFIDERFTAAQELASVSDVVPQAPHNVANALAAAALARAHGVPAGAVRDGLRNFQPAAHRIAEVGVVDGVRYIDDSKATNCHAAQTSLLAYESVVWIAGGMAKGQSFDDLVRLTGDRLRAVVLLGVDREVIAQALARHAPNVPVVEVAGTDDGVMTDVVQAAAGFARPGDTVLLAPGCASWDMFRNYGHRGDAFAAAVGELSA